MYSNNCYYKGKYFIAFYDESGEEFINCFDSTVNILYYLKKPITRKEKNKLDIQIYNAVKNGSVVHFLDGKPRRIYLIEI